MQHKGSCTASLVIILWSEGTVVKGLIITDTLALMLTLLNAFTLTDHNFITINLIFPSMTNFGTHKFLTRVSLSCIKPFGI